MDSTIQGKTLPFLGFGEGFRVLQGYVSGFLGQFYIILCYITLFYGIFCYLTLFVAILRYFTLSYSVVP